MGENRTLQIHLEYKFTNVCVNGTLKAIVTNYKKMNLSFYVHMRVCTHSLKGTYYTTKCQCDKPLQAVLKIGLF